MHGLSTTTRRAPMTIEARVYEDVTGLRVHRVGGFKQSALLRIQQQVAIATLYPLGPFFPINSITGPLRKA